MNEWTKVCSYDELIPERGVAALVSGVQVAVFRTFDGAVHAVANRDPFTGVSVLCRGIVGSRGGTPTVTSPLHKQVFDLQSGRCFDDETVTVPVYPVRRSGIWVEVALRDPGSP